MDELRLRQKKVLEAIVNTYVETINPVGSKTIARHFRDEISPATIRNEMHDLEALDYITHPHTSAGRIPTDKGYRYFVNHFVREAQLGARSTDYIDEEYRKQMENMETLIERTSKILSTLSAQAGIVTFPLFEDFVFRRVELTSLGRQHLLIVWVTENGFIQDRVVDMKEEIPEEDLLRLSRFLNQELRGVLLSDIQSYLTRKLADVHDSLRQLCQIAQTIVSRGLPQPSLRKVHVEGAHRILGQPEFHDGEKSRQLFKILEEKSELSDLLDVDAPPANVCVRIGLEHRHTGIWDCSVVTAHYYVNERRVGSLGVLGPRRMPYGQVISLVDYMARRFGEVLEQW